jgi:ketosteroid isomerase-like protein
VGLRERPANFPSRIKPRHTAAMSSANVELVSSIYAAWERGDYSSAEWADSEIEVVEADGPEPSSVTGLAGMETWVRGFLGAWDEHRAEAEGYRELDSGRVLVLTKISGRGKASGLPVRTKGAHLFHLHSGKVARLVIYMDREQALADLGLTPEAGSQG